MFYPYSSDCCWKYTMICPIYIIPGVLCNSMSHRFSFSPWRAIPLMFLLTIMRCVASTTVVTHVNHTKCHQQPDRHKDHYRYRLRYWRTTLQYNVVSCWWSPYPKCFLRNITSEIKYQLAIQKASRMVPKYHSKITWINNAFRVL